MNNQSNEINVEYCVPCGYLPRTAWMLSEILPSIHEKVGKVTLVPGGGGCFEWTVNGELVYSKNATGRYPDLDELKEAVYAKVG